jgi:ferric-dicitrate binding protein FerR (iron transport regulator)
LLRRILTLFRTRKDAPGEEPLPHGLGFKPKSLSYDEIHDQWEALQAHLHAGPAPLQQPHRTSRTLYRVAAALTGLTLLGLLGYWSHGKLTRSVHETGYGQMVRLVLPDGSEVTLNANSSLTYRKQWPGGHTREVWLEGEAFFHVRRQKQKTRFVVHTGKVRVEVLGTAFNVATRRGRTRVVLQSGRVKLEKAGQPGEAVLMQPRELVEYAAGDRQFRKRAVDPEPYTAWQGRKMRFNDTPIEEVARQLEDTYGLQVTLAGPGLAGRRLSGEISTRNLDVLLGALAALLEADVQRDGDQVTFRSTAPNQDLDAHD